VGWISYVSNSIVGVVLFIALLTQLPVRAALLAVTLIRSARFYRASAY